MSLKRDAPFASYEAWYDYITHECGRDLTPDYCFDRLRELRDPQFPATKNFIEFYGTEYRDLVLSWFERASTSAK